MFPSGELGFNGLSSSWNCKLWGITLQQDYHFSRTSHLHVYWSVGKIGQVSLLLFLIDYNSEGNLNISPEELLKYTIFVPKLGTQDRGIQVEELGAPIHALDIQDKVWVFLISAPLIF